MRRRHESVASMTVVPEEEPPVLPGVDETDWETDVEPSTPANTRNSSE